MKIKDTFSGEAGVHLDPHSPEYELHRLRARVAELEKDRDDLLGACDLVMQYRAGLPPYDFSELPEHDAANAAADAWRDVEDTIRQAIDAARD